MIELIALPLIVGCLIFGLNWLEFSDQDESILGMCEAGLGLLIFILLICFVAGKYGRTWDSEVLNGEVTSKARNIVHCRHSYPCNCHESCSGYGKNRSCWTHCDTCYEHPYDVDWDVYTDINETFSIDTIDSQGLIEPHRWDIVRAGDPVAAIHSFVNYVKAANFSLFHEQRITDKKMLDLIPKYPDNIYDYYNLNRVLSIKMTVPNHNVWNTDLANILRELGPKKQANVIIVMVNDPNPMWAMAIRDKWNGAKKNDIIISIGVNDSNITWVDVYSWSDSSIFKITLRDHIKDIASLKEYDIMQTIEKDTLKYFQRKHMADFKYLKGEIEPNHGFMVFLWVLSVIGSVGALGAFMFINIEEQEEENQRRTYWNNYNKRMKKRSNRYE